jgi:hypothetical protein
MSTTTRIIQLNFTIDEVEKHTITVGDPPIFQMYKRVQGIPKIHNKEYYGKFLCGKLSNALPVQSSIFHIDSTLKPNIEKKTQFCYLICNHKISATIWFFEKDLKTSHELNLTAEVKCAVCLGIVLSTQSSIVACSASIAASTSTVPTAANMTPVVSELQVSFLPSSAYTAIFQDLVTALSSNISNFFMTHGKTDDPMAALSENKVQLVQGITAVCYEALRSIPGPPSSSIAPSDTAPSDDGQSSQQMRDANLVLSESARRLAVERRSRQYQEAEAEGPTNGKRPRVSRRGKKNGGRGGNNSAV